MVSEKPHTDQTSPKVLRLSFLAVAVAVAISLFFYSGNTTEKDLHVPHVVSNSPHSEPAFEVVDLPGRGKGVIALRDIKQGELIIKEKPAIIVPRVFDGVNPKEYIARKLDDMPLSDKEALYNLSYVRFPSHLAAEKPVEHAFAIINTNAVATGDGVGVFPTMARLNHGCSSAFNVVYSWREKTKEIVVYALKDVGKGQELLTTYTNTRRPRSERRSYLQQLYDFHCTCAVCSLPDAESHASDQRLTAMSDLYKRLSTWATASISGREAIQTIREIWALGEREGYWSERGQLAQDAVHIASAHSDGRAVREWAAIAAEWFGYELGAEDERVPQMRAIAADPESAGTWGTRAREQVQVGYSSVSGELELEVDLDASSLNL